LNGRTPEEAVRNFLEPLAAVAACVTDQGFVSRRPRAGEPWRTAHFQDHFAILDRRNGQALRLELRHRYAVSEAQGERGSWTVSTAEYIYEVADESDEVIAAWHWHPTSGQAGDEAHWPHLHAYGTRDTLTLHKLHLPTGRVSIEAIVRFLIEDLDVVPGREDWRAVLDRHEDVFRQTRTWA
jgi:hypothetical protein